MRFKLSKSTLLIFMASLSILSIQNIFALPNFLKYHDVTEKKKAFFDYLIPYIEEINENIYTERAVINKVLTKVSHNSHPSKAELAKVYKISNKYDYEIVDLTKDSLCALLTKVDVVPSSLVLAQAANESAWGTSRFAVKGNNLFGEWCYKQGCGMVPIQRNDNMKHEVRKFSSVKDSIQSYIMNLNTHTAYNKLRSIREKLRRKNKPLTGQELAKGLDHYSERGSVYTDDIIAMIRFNNLEKYNHYYT